MPSRERESVKLDVTLKYQSATEFDSGFAPNVSTHAVFLRTNSPKPVGTAVSLQLRLRSGETVLRGEGYVAWCYRAVALPPLRQAGMGIAFKPTDQESVARVRAIVLKFGEGKNAQIPGSRLLGSASGSAAGSGLASTSTASIPAPPPLPAGSSGDSQRGQAPLPGPPPLPPPIPPAGATGRSGDLDDALSSAFDSIRSDVAIPSALATAGAGAQHPQASTSSPPAGVEDPTVLDDGDLVSLDGAKAAVAPGGSFGFASSSEAIVVASLQDQAPPVTTESAPATTPAPPAEPSTSSAQIDNRWDESFNAPSPAEVHGDVELPADAPPPGDELRTARSPSATEENPDAEPPAWDRDSIATEPLTRLPDPLPQLSAEISPEFPETATDPWSPAAKVESADAPLLPGARPDQATLDEAVEQTPEVHSASEKIPWPGQIASQPAIPAADPGASVEQGQSLPHEVVEEGAAPPSAEVAAAQQGPAVEEAPAAAQTAVTDEARAAEEASAVEEAPAAEAAEAAPAAEQAPAPEETPAAEQALAEERARTDGQDSAAEMDVEEEAVAAIEAAIDSLPAAPIPRPADFARSSEASGDEADAEQRALVDQRAHVASKPEDPAAAELHGRLCAEPLPPGQEHPALQGYYWITGGPFEEPWPATAFDWPAEGSKRPVSEIPSTLNEEAWSKFSSELPSEDFGGNDVLLQGSEDGTFAAGGDLGLPLRSIAAEQTYVRELTDPQLPAPTAAQLGIDHTSDDLDVNDEDVFATSGEHEIPSSLLASESVSSEAAKQETPVNWGDVFSPAPEQETERANEQAPVSKRPYAAPSILSQEARAVIPETPATPPPNTDHSPASEEVADIDAPPAPAPAELAPPAQLSETTDLAAIGTQTQELADTDDTPAPTPAQLVAPPPVATAPADAVPPSEPAQPPVSEARPQGASVASDDTPAPTPAAFVAPASASELPPAAEAPPEQQQQPVATSAVETDEVADTDDTPAPTPAELVAPPPLLAAQPPLDEVAPPVETTPPAAPAALAGPAALVAPAPVIDPPLGAEPPPGGAPSGAADEIADTDDTPAPTPAELVAPPPVGEEIADTDDTPAPTPAELVAPPAQAPAAAATDAQPAVTEAITDRLPDLTSSTRDDAPSAETAAAADVAVTDPLLGVGGGAPPAPLLSAAVDVTDPMLATGGGDLVDGALPVARDETDAPSSDRGGAATDAGELATDAAEDIALSSPIGIALPGGKMRNLLEVGTRAPYTYERTLQVPRGQNVLELDFHQGNAADVNDNQALGKIQVTGEPAEFGGRLAYDVRIAIEPDAVLSVEVKDPAGQVVHHSLVATLDVSEAGRQRVEAQRQAQAEAVEAKVEEKGVFGFFKRKLRGK